ncbi:MAG: hypothetical protein QOJ89_4319 [bacterium]
MTMTHRDKPPSTQRAATSREREAPRATRDQPARPLTAAQLAAPSTRRWRRAGRFAPTTR